MAVEPFWDNFWTLFILEFLSVFAAVIIFLSYNFFDKITKFLGGTDAFSIKKFSSRFLGGNGSQLLKFDFSYFAHNSLNNGSRAVLKRFLDFQYLLTF